MPKIPTYQAQVEYRPALGNVEAAGAAGKAVARFGELAGAVGGQIAETVAARAKTAEAEAERAKGTARATAALRQTVEAFAADSDPGSMMARYLEQADGIGRDISGGIRDSGARGQFDADFKNLAAVHGTLVQRDMLRNLAGQGRRELDDHLGLYAETAAAASHPVEHDDMVALALREIRGKAEAGFITEADAARLARGFHADLAERQTRRHMAADPEAALAWLKSGAESDALGADSRARLTAEAERAARALSLRRDTEAASARRDTLSGLSDHLAALRDDEATDDRRFSREQLSATLGAEDGAKRWAEIEDARAFGAAMARVKWATPDDIAERTAGLAADATQSEAAARLARARARRDEQLHDKPADYVLQNPRIAELHDAMVQATAQPPVAPAVAAAVQQAGGMQAPTADDRRAAVAAYANGTLAEQERLGVPESRRQVLPETLARETATRLAGATPDEAAGSLAELARDWGADWPRAVADLRRAGLPSAYHLLAGLDDPVARQTLTKVLTAQASEPGALGAKAGADADAIDESVDRHRAGVDSRILSGDHGKLVKLLAYHYAQTTEPEDAVRRAIGDLGGNALPGARPDTTSRGTAGHDHSDSVGLPMASDERAATPWVQDQGEDRSVLAQMFPPGSPQDEADRAAVMEAAGRRLGRHVPRVPAKPKAVPLVTNTGERIMLVNKDGQLVEGVIPEGLTLRRIVSAGETLRALSKSKDDYALSVLAPLVLFSHGLPWDFQRVNAPSGQIHHEFRPVSSAGIGAYGAAVGMSFENLMQVQVVYAKIFSKWATKSDGEPEEKISEDYPPLPESNVRNTKIGYDLQIAGKVK